MAASIGGWIVTGDGAEFDCLGTCFFPLAVVRVRVYGLLMGGWGRRSKFGVLGAYRAVAQRVSFELGLSCIVLVGMYFCESTCLEDSLSGPHYGLPGGLLAWIVIMAAETSRPPFDFREGESELVSGFRTEHGGRLFMLYFLSEYAGILFLAGWGGVLIEGGTGAVLVVVCLLTRSLLPRYRYDLIIRVLWEEIVAGCLGLI